MSARRFTAEFYDGPHRGETRSSIEPRLAVTEVEEPEQGMRAVLDGDPISPYGARYRIDAYGLRRDQAGKLWWILERGAA